VLKLLDPKSLITIAGEPSLISNLRFSTLVIQPIRYKI
jgi:hypothetical protein